jgi:hypothetical protein
LELSIIYLQIGSIGYLWLARKHLVHYLGVLLESPTKISCSKMLMVEAAVANQHGGQSETNPI